MLRPILLLTFNVTWALDSLRLALRILFQTEYYMYAIKNRPLTMYKDKTGLPTWTSSQLHNLVLGRVYSALIQSVYHRGTAHEHSSTFNIHHTWWRSANVRHIISTARRNNSVYVFPEKGTKSDKLVNITVKTESLKYTHAGLQTNFWRTMRLCGTMLWQGVGGISI